MAAQYPHGRDPGNSLGRHYSDFQLIGLAKPLSRRPSISENLQNPVPIGEVRLTSPRHIPTLPFAVTQLRIRERLFLPHSSRSVGCPVRPAVPKMTLPVGSRRTGSVEVESRDFAWRAMQAKPPDSHIESRSRHPRSSTAMKMRSRWGHHMPDGILFHACHTGVAICQSTDRQ
jgi:hypothetical protein